MTDDRGLTFDDVVVAPYEELMRTARGGSPHKGGPRWPDWDAQREARHNRAGQPVDDEPSAVEPVAQLDEAAWGGALTRHYGHQIADYSMRLLATLEAWPGVPVLFATDPAYGLPDLADAPAWFGQILDWFGVPPADRRLITVPTVVSRLHVAPQAEQLFGPGPSDATLDRLDELTRQRLGPVPADGARVTYVSRAGQVARFAGEGYLEDALTAIGVEVLRPETLPLADQLRRYRGTSGLAFAEGSALHSLQLMGRLRTSITVLNRRPKGRMVRASLESRAAGLRFADVTLGLVHGLRPNGRPATNYGIAVVDPGLLLEALFAAGIDLTAVWDQGAYLAARDGDLHEWIERQAEARSSHTPASLEHIVQTLDLPSLEALRDEAANSLLRASRPTANEHRPTRAANLINQLASAIGATAYLEVGVAHGATLRTVSIADRTGVDPRPKTSKAEMARLGIELHEITSDAFFTTLTPDQRYDVVFIDGLHQFEQAYRDLQNAQRHTHEGSVIVLDDTLPSDRYSAMPDQLRALTERRRVTGSGDQSWHGDVYKVVFAIHELHPELDHATTNDSDNPRTIVWRAETTSETRGWRLEEIARLTYDDLMAGLDVLRLMPEAEAVARCVEALRMRSRARS